MAQPATCPECGMTQPAGRRRCASCGHRFRRGRVGLWIVGAFVVASGIAAGVWASRPRESKPLEEMLDTGFAGMQLTSDGRRTDVTGVLVNRGDVALDVTIHVVARDHRDNIIANELVGTFPNVPTSMVITLRHTLDLAPVKSAEFLVIKAERSAPP